VLHGGILPLSSFAREGGKTKKKRRKPRGRSHHNDARYMRRGKKDPRVGRRSNLFSGTHAREKKKKKRKGKKGGGREESGRRNSISLQRRLKGHSANRINGFLLVGPKKGGKTLGGKREENRATAHTIISPRNRTEGGRAERRENGGLVTPINNFPIIPTKKTVKGGEYGAQRLLPILSICASKERRREGPVFCLSSRSRKGKIKEAIISLLPRSRERGGRKDGGLSPFPLCAGWRGKRGGEGGEKKKRNKLHGTSCSLLGLEQDPKGGGGREGGERHERVSGGDLIAS